MREGTLDLYRFMDERKATITGHKSRARPKPFMRPDSLDAWQVRSLTTLTGTVFRIGGEKHKVEIKPARGGRVVECTGTGQLIDKLGPFIRKSVILKGECIKDSYTGVIEEFIIHDVKADPYDVDPKSDDPRAALRRLHEAMGGALDGVPVGALIREGRK